MMLRQECGAHVVPLSRDTSTLAQMGPTSSAEAFWLQNGRMYVPLRVTISGLAVILLATPNWSHASSSSGADHVAPKSASVSYARPANHLTGADDAHDGAAGV